MFSLNTLILIAFLKVTVNQGSQELQLDPINNGLQNVSLTCSSDMQEAQFTTWIEIHYNAEYFNHSDPSCQLNCHEVIKTIVYNQFIKTNFPCVYDTNPLCRSRFRCDNGFTVHPTLLCDGVNDCGNHEDEASFCESQMVNNPVIVGRKCFISC